MQSMSDSWCLTGDNFGKAGKQECLSIGGKMDALNDQLKLISGFVWGVPLLMLLGGTGVYLSIRLRFLQLRMLGEGFRLAFLQRGSRGSGDISRFQALMTTSAATIGTGNIVGVSTAIAIGGPGALFWMWLIAVVGMATKYAEAVLAVTYRVRSPRGEMLGGPMLYLERGLNRKWLAVTFAAFGAFAGFGIGNMVQANAVATNLESLAAVDPRLTGFGLAVLTGLVLLGGIRGIGRTAGIVVPFMALLYLAGCLWILISLASQIPAAFQSIIHDAFAGTAATGGFVGSSILLAARMGVARGVFSNESGLGSSPIAAAAARTDEPCEQGLVSMIDTFLDTLVVCTMTGLVLLVSGTWADGADRAGSMVQDAFAAGLPGRSGGIFVGIGIVFFAYSTILGWAYYGERCVEYLFGEGAIRIYRVLWVVAVFVGAGAKLELVWNAADILNGLMALPNLIGLIGLSGVVAEATRRYVVARART